ncbi:hypothetical protein [Streptomyces sp. KN37]|uniref:hypothetical protein n=1 Tax=Streptomyces sp. KN37 TaxID=3090667 RepID=UPI002A75EF8F|nr:hypothetical protein [Streptomyces sp. KN37]WPO70184.1 hypothetical protein R9806_05860 [Streptomyces sp. KN37]
MTTAAAPSVTWVRLMADGVDFTLAPSPGVTLRLTLLDVEPDELPLSRTSPLERRVIIDLLPRDTEAAIRCETQARELAARIGLDSAVLHEVAMEAALDGEDLPYSRVEAPRLLPVAEGPPTLEVDGPESFVRAFTAKMLSDGGVAYTMRRVD